MAEIARLSSAEDRRDNIHRCVQLLSDGQVVGLPTETGYVLAASALSPVGVSRLKLITNRPLVLMPQSADSAADYLPQLSRSGDKLRRRAWPGPLQLGVDATAHSEGLFTRLPEPVRTALLQPRLLVRVSSQDIVQEIQQLMPGPLVASDESAQAPIQSVGQLAELATSEVALLLEGGPVRFPNGITVAQLSGDSLEVPHVGVIAAESVKRLTAEVFLFVCTGNTCRSPMAEALFRHKLTQKLGCDESELAERGFYVASAGTAAGYGMPASPESAAILAKRGIDLTLHSSQPLTERLLQQADYVFTMTRGHRRAILAERADMSERVQVLAPDGSDVPDPIGAGMEEYERCQRAIEQYLDVILSKLFSSKASP